MQALRKDESTPALRFLIEQILIIHPLTLPIWIAGIFFFIFFRTRQKIPDNGMDLYYSIDYFSINERPIILYGTGLSDIISCWFGNIGNKTSPKTNKLAEICYSCSSAGVSAFITSPLWLPVLSIEKMKKFGIADISYDFREMIGWPELVSSVSTAYNSLSKEEQMNTIIITGNYGEAGSINHYGPKFGLPIAASGIGSYYYWGPGNPDATSAIFIGYSEAYLSRLFSEVNVLEIFRNEYGINNEEQGIKIILCRKPNKPISELWSEFKHF